jgi:putative intracellular protease/amidase/Tol biopolymer transport system component
MRKFVSVVLWMIFLVMLSGCGAGATEPASSPPTHPSIPSTPTAAPQTPTPTPDVKQALVILYPRFEEREYGQTRQALEESGVVIAAAAPSLEPVQGHQGTDVAPDTTLRDAHAADYDAVVFIGGYEFDFDDPEAIRLAQEAVAEAKVLAAICAAPKLLAQAGLLQGRRATTSLSPSVLENEGAIYTGLAVERDGLIITANGPAASSQFGEAVVAALEEHKTETAAPFVTPTEPPAPTATARPKRLHEWADLRPGQGPVYSQSWSPDGRWLVTADYDQIKVWDVESRREAGVLVGHSNFVWGLAWSPDGNVLASASQDGSLRFWDVSTYTETAVLDTGWAFCVAWSPDGHRLAVGNAAGQVQIWDVATQQLLDFWRSTASSFIISVAWSPDGKTIAAGELSGGIDLWDVATGQARATLTGYTTARCDVNGLAWSPDGTTLASAHQDGQIRLWDGETAQPVRAIAAHTGWARGIAWSPSGHLLASTGEDKRICLWDPETGQGYAEEHHNHLPVWSVSWSPDGTKVASGAGAYEQQHVGATIVWAVP